MSSGAKKKISEPGIEPEYQFAYQFCVNVSLTVIIETPQWKSYLPGTSGIFWNTCTIVEPWLRHQRRLVGILYSPMLYQLSYSEFKIGVIKNSKILRIYIIVFFKLK